MEHPLFLLFSPPWGRACYLLLCRGSNLMSFPIVFFVLKRKRFHLLKCILKFNSSSRFEMGRALTDIVQGVRERRQCRYAAWIRQPNSCYILNNFEYIKSKSKFPAVPQTLWWNTFFKDAFVSKTFPFKNVFCSLFKIPSFPLKPVEKITPWNMENIN